MGVAINVGGDFDEIVAARGLRLNGSGAGEGRSRKEGNEIVTSMGNKK